MITTSGKNLLIGVLLITGFWGGFALKPTKHITTQGSKINLEEMIPKEFSGWKIDETVVPLQVSPDRVALLNKLYNQTLSRTYKNENGEIVMLSIAYGGDQSDAMQVHKPEVCYVAQGFQIESVEIDSLDTGYGLIPVKRLFAQMGQRYEPITYWITIGDTVAVNSLKWKLQQLKYGLTGNVPDGLLFRISSIGQKENAYALQNNFTQLLMKSLTPEDRKRLIGSSTL